MKILSFIMFIEFNYVLFGSLCAQNIKTDKIESIKIQSTDMPSDFYLYQESIAKPGLSPNEIIYHSWRKGMETHDQPIIEDEKHIATIPIGSCSLQKWYRENKSGAKDKIEIDIRICSSDEELNKIITLFTKETYAAPYIQSATPNIGEKSWIPKNIDQTKDSYSVMFLESNIFVRLYIRIKDKDINELQQITQKLAEKVEKNIISLNINE